MTQPDWDKHRRHNRAKLLIEAQEHIKAARDCLCMVYANMSIQHPQYEAIKQRCAVLYATNLPTEDLGSSAVLFDLSEIIEGIYKYE